MFRSSSPHARTQWLAAAGDQVTVQTKARDYGINTVAVDGTTAGAPLDAYNTPDVTVTGPIGYGTMPLAAGRHTLTITVTGHNPASAGFFTGLDYFTLTLAS